MPVTFKKRLFREDPSIDFYRSSSEFESYVQTTYVQTGKIISWRTQEYIDEAAQIVEYETTYRDRAALDEALVDPEFKKDGELNTDYCYYNSIRLLSIQINDAVSEIPCDPTRTLPIDASTLGS